MKREEKGPGDSKQLLAARSWLSSQSQAILDDQIEIARTPAPPFQERARAELVTSKVEPLDLEPELDDIGNVLVPLPPNGSGTDRQPVIIAAHLDTVFEAETPVRIRNVGRRWIGPGIADNARGLAVAISVVRALVQCHVQPRHPIVFAFTVGEEGSGDLRGVKHLFNPESPFRSAEAFIALDGSGLRRIVHRALGSRRYRVSIRGPGGHSWSDWGRANPAHAIGRFIHGVASLELPREPRTTLTVTRLGGGVSVNAIPAECWVDLDLRSESGNVLQTTENRIRKALGAAASAEGARGEGRLTTAVELIGDRPTGRLPASHPLMTTAIKITEALGELPEPAASSTDANVPISLGIPAIALGGGGLSGDAHSEREWFEDTDGAAGALRMVSLLASIAKF